MGLIHAITLRGAVSLTALSLAVAVLAASRPERAEAHPLGNFTINTYSRVVVHSSHVDVHYVLDMAEIPAFREIRTIDRDEDGYVDDDEKSAYLAARMGDILKAIHLMIGGKTIELGPVEQTLEFPPGQAGLDTLRLSALLRGALPSAAGSPSQEVHYRDDNFAERIGWREIVIQAGQGVAIQASTVPATDTSDELRSYPQGTLDSPPSIREARATFALSAGGGSAEGQASPWAMTDGPEVSKDGLTSLITADRMSLPVTAFAFALALGIGAAHAMSPGHGKTIMAAYLVGSRGTARHALFLGLVVTVSHTLGVLGLGLAVLFASHLAAPERLYPWLSVASGVLIVAIGLWLVARRLREVEAYHAHSHAHHHHHHGADGRLPLTWKGLAALAVVGGLVPSASALVLLLAAVSLHRVGLGLALVLAFSIGMAAVLAGVGLSLVYVGHVLERLRPLKLPMDTAARWIPRLTALFVLLSGLFVTARAVFQMGLL